MKTESERHFESFCRRNGFELLPVPVGIRKTPDYLLRGTQQVVVVEVKELLPTREEQESDQVVAERGVGTVIGATPGERVRKKIADCSKQIKARTMGRHPGLLVLWEGGHCAGRHTEPCHIRAAMEVANRTISAVAVLCMPGPDTLLLQVFHHPHAAVPLKPSSLQSADVRHFSLRDDPRRTTAWVQL